MEINLVSGNIKDISLIYFLIFNIQRDYNITFQSGGGIAEIKGQHDCVQVLKFQRHRDMNIANNYYYQKLTIGKLLMLLV